MQRHAVLFTLHCHDVVSDYFHLVVQAMQKSIFLWNHLIRGQISCFSCHTLGFCNTRFWGYFGESEEYSVSVPEANFLLPSMYKKPTRCRCHFCVIFYFSCTSCSTCFGQLCAHLQELTIAQCYRHVLVLVSSWRWAHGCPKHVEQIVREK